MGKSSGKFLPRALRLITDEGDVETHGDNNHLTHGVAFLYLPQCLNWTLDSFCRQQRQTLLCPSCQHVVPLSVLQVIPLQRWKEDPEFVKQMKDGWKDNPFWYGICYEDDNVMEGFWGELRDPYETHRKTLYFLGHTKTQAIARMNTCMSF